jgi:hypothetical protein
MSKPIKGKPWIDMSKPENRIGLADLRTSGMLDRLTLAMFGKTVAELREGRDV